MSRGVYSWAYTWDSAIQFALMVGKKTGRKHYVYRNRSTRYLRWEIEPR